MENIHGLNRNGPAILATGVVFTVLAVVAVALRYVSKRITQSFRIDDWLLLGSLVLYFIAEVLVMRSVVIGRRATSPEDHQYLKYQQYLYVYSIFYFVVIALVQASILLLYRQIFLPTHIHYTSLFLIVICAIWCATALVIEIGYPGYPISYYFPGSSSTVFHITYLSFWLAMALTEALIETVILILPIREILHLQLSTKKKVLLSLMFALGSFVVITAIVRMAVLYKPNDTNLDLTQGNIWFNIHLSSAIISACLPTYRPLVSRKTSFGQLFYPSRGSYQIDDSFNLEACKKRTQTSDSPSINDDTYPQQQSQRRGNLVDAHGGEGIGMTRSDSQGGTVEPGTAIGVRQTVDVG